MKPVAEQTNQEVFDTVVKHLLEQNYRAYDVHDGRCAYLDGHRKCAIGCLIPEELYDFQLEGRSVVDFFNKSDAGRFSSTPEGKVGCWLFPAVNEHPAASEVRLRLLRALQDIHDDFPVDEWREALAKTASHFNLTMPKEYQP